MEFNFIYEETKFKLEIDKIYLLLEKSTDVPDIIEVPKKKYDNNIQEVNKIIDKMRSFNSTKDSLVDTVKKKIEEWVEKLKVIFNKLLVSVSEYIRTVKIRIETRLQQKDLQNKLSELKEILSKNRAFAYNGKVEAIDVERYYKFYSDFIEKYTEELLTGLNKDFKNYDEFKKWSDNMSLRLSEFDFKLSNDDVWKITTSVNSLVKLTEDEIKNREKIISMIHEKYEKTSKKIKNQVIDRYDITKVMNNYREEYPKLLEMKYAYAGNQLTKFANMTGNVATRSAKFILSNIMPLTILYRDILMKL